MADQIIAGEVLEAVRELKSHIKDAATQAVDNFRYKTGLSPSGISINMIDASSPSDTAKRYLVGRVSVDLSDL